MDSSLVSSNPGIVAIIIIILLIVILYMHFGSKSSFMNAMTPQQCAAGPPAGQSMDTFLSIFPECQPQCLAAAPGRSGDWLGFWKQHPECHPLGSLGITNLLQKNQYSREFQHTLGQDAKLVNPY